MRTTLTCGPEDKRVSFEYELLAAPTVRWVNQSGSVVVICGHFLDRIRSEFPGRTIPGGFSEDNPPPDGLGAWVRDNSTTLNDGQALTPRHASRIAAIMRDLGWVECCVLNRAVVIRFLVY
jgi:hypothetical protein